MLVSQGTSHKVEHAKDLLQQIEGIHRLSMGIGMPPLRTTGINPAARRPIKILYRARRTELVATPGPPYGATAPTGSGSPGDPALCR